MEEEHEKERGRERRREAEGAGGRVERTAGTRLAAPAANNNSIMDPNGLLAKFAQPLQLCRNVLN